MDHLLIAASIYASLFCYVAAAGCWITGRRGNRYRGLWTCACLLLWVHAASALHFYHHWSHEHVVQHTAMETELILGWRFGQGIWFSYGLLVLWLLHVIILWRTQNADSTRRQQFEIAVHAYAFFILFNGTVVFETGVIQLAGVIASCVLVCLAWRTWKPSRTSVDRIQG